jgi:hypothetical protein
MSSTTTNGSLDGAAVPRRRRVGRYALLALRVLLAVEFAGAGLAAAGLAVLMTGAFLTHATVLDGAPVIEAVFLAGALVVAVARRADIRRLRGGGGTR